MGSTRIRSKTPARPTSIVTSKENTKIPELRVDSAAPSPVERPARKHKCSGAMAQQSGDSSWGNQSAPQKLLHLVGCREPKRSSR